MPDNDAHSRHDRWARLRFSIVGPLLAAPPARGELRAELARLAAKQWRHPITGEIVVFAASTIERWYYAARAAADPVGKLRRRVRKDAGAQPSMGLAIRAALRAQYREHLTWTYKLHADNLAALAEADPSLGPAPSYPTVRRFMKANGLFRRKKKPARGTAAAERAAARLEQVEVRSYEVSHVHALWHVDFHVGHRRVVLPDGRWVSPQMLCVIDDYSRLACHAQWYLTESSETLVHGLSQAIQKRGVPRALMHDNGPAMTAAETQQGLLDLSITAEPTLEYSPHQNAKLECFWGRVEGRLLAMLEGVEQLTLELLNESTQPWVEHDYNRHPHSEIGTTPLRRALEEKDLSRPSPGSDELRRAFRLKDTRRQRRSDGTISVEGRRFEVPSRLRHVERLTVRYARWDLRRVDAIDPRSGAVLASLWPLDKTANADGRRRRHVPIGGQEEQPVDGPAASGIAPLLKKQMEDYAASGLAPAYLPKPIDPQPIDDDDEGENSEEDD